MNLSPNPEPNNGSYEARAQVGKALSHPTRLLIIDALAHREMCVSELTDLAGIDQSTMSRHVALLSHAGLVDRRKHGLKTYCTLKIQCLNAFWSCIESALTNTLSEPQTVNERCH